MPRWRQRLSCGLRPDFARISFSVLMRGLDESGDGWHQFTSYNQ
jgi:hypothetical protein